MKERMDENSKLQLIQYRIERAEETLKEADVMNREAFYNAAMNRLYYACFYATMALLLKHDIYTTTHAGVKTMLGLHFVAKGILSKEDGKTFNRLFEIRHSSDYDDFVYCDKEMVDTFYPKAEQFISAVKQLVKVN